MFLARLNFDDWINDISNLRVWVFIESIFFFSWISASSIFVSVAYLWKLEPTNKTEEMMKLDDDPWNDRNACDFLTYIKYDYYIVTLNLTLMIMEVLIGFTDYLGLDKMGERPYISIKIMFGLLIASSIL